jgi:adenosine deaminase
VDIHRHMEGSLRLSTLMEIAGRYQDILPPSRDIAALGQVQEDDEMTFNNFLSKFQVLRDFYQTPEIIRRVVYEVIEDAAREGIVYLELRFAPVALSRVRDFPMGEVMDWVIEQARQASEDHKIITRLVTTVNRHEEVSLAEKVFQMAVERIDKGIVAVDLAGNEADFSALPFAGVIREARESGLLATIHAGEWAGAENVREALEVLQVDRIGHGVRVLEDPETVQIARQRNATFEVCVTSNYQSGVVPSIEDHPLPRMLEAGLNVTINADDPGISQITLIDEYRLVCEKLNLSVRELSECILTAARASFLPQQEHQDLVAMLSTRLAGDLKS